MLQMNNIECVNKTFTVKGILSVIYDIRLLFKKFCVVSIFNSLVLIFQFIKKLYRCSNLPRY